jgi:hypothetical protein
MYWLLLSSGFSPGGCETSIFEPCGFETTLLVTCHYCYELSPPSSIEQPASTERPLIKDSPISKFSDMWKIGDPRILAASCSSATGYQVRQCTGRSSRNFLSSRCICIYVPVSLFSDKGVSEYPSTMSLFHVTLTDKSNPMRVLLVRTSKL